MDVDLIFKIAAVGILVAVLNLVLARSGREEQAKVSLQIAQWEADQNHSGGIGGGADDAGAADQRPV